MMGTMPSILFHLVPSILIISIVIQPSSSQFPFTLDIPDSEKCATCDFNWPSTSHYGYSFSINNDGTTTTIDLDNSGLVTFSAITINYNTFNTSDPSCDTSSNNFLEEYNYQINIYHDDGTSWRSKGTKSGSINREINQLDRISLNDGTIDLITLTSGDWYVGLRLGWSRTTQQCSC